MAPGNQNQAVTHEHLEPIWKKIDEHAQMHGETKLEIAVVKGDVKNIIKDQGQICKTLYETKTEVVTRQEMLSEKLDGIKNENLIEKGRQLERSRMPQIIGLVLIVLQILVIARTFIKP
jgi:hypothetical protein